MLLCGLGGVFTADFKATRKRRCASFLLYLSSLGFLRARAMSSYVRRNWKGEITDVHPRPQLKDGLELLADDDPELVAFLQKAGRDEKVRQFSAKEQAGFKREYEKAIAEEESIQLSVSAFAKSFAMLEDELSKLLSRIINAGGSKIAFAIYYSPTSFDARSEIVSNSVI
jgi:hypothetical protein